MSRYTLLMKEMLTKNRQSKYCLAIESVMAQLGHATNADILAELRRLYPTLSATTVHRATARLAARGRLMVAPAGADGSMRYDANLSAHDHFECQKCFRLRDADIKAVVMPAIQAAISDCEIGGRLVITGLCKKCHEVKEIHA